MAQSDGQSTVVVAQIAFDRDCSVIELHELLEEVVWIGAKNGPFDNTHPNPPEGSAVSSLLI